MSNTLTSNNAIRWTQLLALLGLDVAIIISWIAYHEYQPILLEQFGFKHLTLFLAISQGIILAVTPPVAGYLADRIRKKRGDRLPIINIGISLVSMIFMAVAVFLLGSPGGWLKLFFPVLIALWLIAMNLFHTPAISTVEMFVPVHKLPGIMAIFLVVADASQAIEPMMVPLFRNWGAPLTFGIGGALITITGILFIRATRKMEAPVYQEETEERKSNLVYVLLLGLIMGLATLFFFKILPELARGNKLEWPFKGGISSRALCSILIAGAGLLTYPAGRLLDGRKLGKYLIGALLFSVAAALMASLMRSEWSFAGCIAYAVGFAVLTVTLLPMAFQNLGKDRLILGIGLFFAGVELPSSIMEIIQALG